MNAISVIQRTSDNPASAQSPDDMQTHLRNMLALHFDPEHGSRYWLRRQKILGIDVLQEVKDVEDLRKLGPMDERTTFPLSL